MNVVLIVSDDMRPELGKAYNQPLLSTPNLDKLAEKSLVFNKAYTQFAICSASRNSFLSGRRPDRTQVWNFINDFRQVGQNWTTFPEHFKNNGYTTLGCGKIYHPGHPPNNDEPKSWSQDRPYGKQAPKGCDNATFCIETSTDPNSFNDYKMAQTAISNLKYVVEKGGNFFIAMGLHYPHATWRVPEWAVKLYEGKVKAPLNPYPPKGMPDIAFTEEMDGNMYLSEIFRNGSKATFPVPSPTKPDLPDWFMEDLRTGYYSAVSLSDFHIGLLLDEIEKLGIENDTIIVFIADHGYQLGEHAEWAKHTNWELAVRVPMIIKAPHKPKSFGTRTETLADLQDLYKTVASLAGVPDVEEGVEGIDLSPLFENKDLPLRTASFSQYSRCPEAGEPVYYHPNCEEVPKEKIGVMGYSVRDQLWRYTEWFKWNGTSLKAEWDEPSVGRELYSHSGDDGVNYDKFENQNIVDEPGHEEIVKRLRETLLKHFRDQEQ